MSLVDKISAEVIDAYKSGDTKKRILLQTIKASLIKAQKDSGKSISHDDEIGILKSELKIRQQAKEDYIKGNRNDLVSQVDEEIKIIKTYLPEQLTDEQILEEVKNTIKEMDKPDFGQVMQIVMSKLKGQADGSQVSKIVREQLND